MGLEPAVSPPKDRADEAPSGRQGSTATSPAPKPEDRQAAQPTMATTDEGATAAASNDKERTAGRVVDWPASSAEKRPLVTLYVVRTGDNRGVLRAQQGEKRRDLESFTLQPGSTPELEVKTLATGTALFRYSPAAGASERNQRVVLLLGWDDKEERVKVLKRWRGGKTQTEPAWLETGRLATGPSELGKCAQVVRRISQCAKDPAFRNALFHDLSGPERQDAARALTSQAPEWGTAEAARQQCEQWAGEGYVDTQFSDPDELKELVKDTKLDCNFFGREIDDEGGLPQPVAAGGPEPR